MNPVNVYKGLCDVQRMRILNLLRDGPLCVCHLMEVLEADQVKISKQLRYMKRLGLVESERAAQWMIYRLADRANPLLEENLESLRAHCGKWTRFSEDDGKGRAIRKRIEQESPPCAEGVGSRGNAS
ncbi:MAG: ArsR/SmtB family transcription factor [Oceanipulchritudo sp.]